MNSALGTMAHLAFYHKVEKSTESVSKIAIIEEKWSKVGAKIQQTKMLVTCQRFGDLFLFGLIWQNSSKHKTFHKGRFKVIATYLQQ